MRKTISHSFFFLVIFCLLIPSCLSASYQTKLLKAPADDYSESEKQNKEIPTIIKPSNQDKKISKDQNKHDIKLSNKKIKATENKKEEDSTELPKQKDKKFVIYSEPTSNPIQKKHSSGSKKNYGKLQSFDQTVFMDSKKTYLLQWKTNKTHITFEVQVKTLGWIGLGLSPTGAMTNSDIAVMWVENGKLTLQDRFAEGFFEPIIDKQQDWIPLYGFENETHTTVGFSRLLETCDERDRKVTKDTVHVLYAYHSRDPPNGQLMKHEERGSRTIVFTGSSLGFKEPKYEKKLTFNTNNFHIPSENATTYRCFLRQINGIDKKYHMIATNPVISPETSDIVHHIFIHLCDPKFNNPTKINDMLCYEDAHSGDIMRHCYNELLLIWAIGGESVYFPEDIGYPIDTDINGRWVYMEVHYNNYKMVPDLIDNTIIEIYLTDKRMKQEAGLLMFGLFDVAWGLLIPPKQKEFSITAYCSQHCLNNMKIPDDGLNVFLYFIHTHFTGRKIQIRIIRDGKELEPIMKDENYDANFQVFRSLPKPFKIMKGDAILLECTYSTMDKDNYTIGGFQSVEEMCFGYMYYYPKTDFNICGSLPSYPSFIEGLGANVTKEKSGLAEILTWKRHPESLKNRNIVLTQMNSDEWKSDDGVEKLKTVYKNINYDEICRYMTLPEIQSGKLPKYKPFKQAPSTCVNSHLGE